MDDVYLNFFDIRAVLNALPASDEDAAKMARARNAELTKPPGALGRLEDLAIWFAGWQGAAAPRIDRPQIAVFAGNHGVARLGVSAFPPDVTQQMVANFMAGGAAINQLASLSNAAFSVHPIELDEPTNDFTQDPAMTEAECVSAMKIGADAVDPSSDCLIVGEMGIGNTTAAAALFAAHFGGTGSDWVGRGTGLDDDGLKAKARVVDLGLNRHRSIRGLDALAAFGGREMAAMAGAILRARALCIPVILDGFICTSAATCLWSEASEALDHCVAGHLSNEQSHASALEALNLSPIVDLGMRLGEGSGAAVALLILRAALACHSEMATFAEAGVAGAV
ncbi:MAG: nicotinate-nucleotide--dimethylbenzimidazole phosphoribosyltransferase [Pseudomonadota bacterium]